MTMPAPTLFQNEAANLTRSLRCNVDLLSKCSSSRMSVLLRWLTGAEIIAEDRQVIPQRHCCGGRRCCKAVGPQAMPGYSRPTTSNQTHRRGNGGLREAALWEWCWS